MAKKTLLLATGFVLLWNSGFIGAEFGFAYTGPFSLLFWRYLALTLVLFLYLLVRNRLWWIGRRRAATNMAIGILSHGVWLGCVAVSIDYGVPAGVVALVVAL
ncbi:MAG: EamA/RhaT family transporter, partial [Spirochaetia bacterium]